MTFFFLLQPSSFGLGFSSTVSSQLRPSSLYSRHFPHVPSTRCIRGVPCQGQFERHGRVSISNDQSGIPMVFLPPSVSLPHGVRRFVTAFQPSMQYLRLMIRLRTFILSVDDWDSGPTLRLFFFSRIRIPQTQGEHGEKAAVTGGFSDTSLHTPTPLTPF